MEVMAFVAVYWWIWPLTAIVSGVFAFRSFLGFDSDEHFAGKTFLGMVFFWVSAGLAVLSLVLNLILYAKHI